MLLAASAVLHAVIVVQHFYATSDKEISKGNSLLLQRAGFVCIHFLLQPQITRPTLIIIQTVA